MRIFAWGLRDELPWLLFWSTITGGVTSAVVVIFPLFGDVFEVMMKEAVLVKLFLGRFAPELMDGGLLDAWLGVELFGWFGILAGIYPIVFASNAIAGDIERHTMELILSQPISRSRVLLEKFAVIAVNLAIICAATFLVLIATIAICVPESGSLRAYACIFLNNYFLLLAIAALGFLCSVIMGSQRAALSIGVGLLLLSYVLYILHLGLSIVDVDPWFTHLTPFYYADATKILATGKADWADNAKLATTAAAALAAALVLFRKKDIPA